MAGHSPDEGTEGTNRRIRWQELLLVSLSLGALAGSIFASVDVFFNTTGQHSPKEFLVAFVLASVLSMVAMGGLALALAVALRVLGSRLSRQQWLALLLAVAFVALVAAEVLLGTTAWGRWIHLLVLLASFPVAVTVHGIATRTTCVDVPGVGLSAILVALNAVVLINYAVASVRAGESALLWTSVAAAALLGLAMVARFSLGRSPNQAVVSLVVFLGLSLAAFSGIGRLGQGGASIASERTAEDPPDVVLIVLDTTRRDRLGVYGHPGGLTPALDALAAESAVYEDAFSTSPWTIPSHASMFTGWYPVTHGSDYPHHIYIDDEFVTLAEMLADIGYQTAAFTSNYHLSRCNAFQGFETSLFGGGPYDGWRVKKVAEGLGFPERWVDKGGYEVHAELGSWLANTRNPNEPSFIFVNLFEPHAPYLPPVRERATHLPDGVGYVEATRFALDFDHTHAHITGLIDPYTETLVDGLYDGGVRYQDRRLGEILSLLRTYLDFENILLIVTADHGENIGDGARWEHQFAINDTLIHVPLIIRYPDLFPPGSRIEGLCQLVDLIPTIFEVIGREQPVPGLPGRTLVPKHFVAREAVYAQVSPSLMSLRKIEITRGAKAGVGHFNAELRTLHTGRFKYVWASDGQHGLFDVQEDPMETFDLSDHLPDTARALHEDLLSWWAEQPPYVGRDGTEEIRPMDPELIERLRSLGYIN